MGLAKLIGEIATHGELVTLIEKMDQEQEKMRNAIKWVLGENGEFSEPVRHTSQESKPFWWRAELRKKAGL